jgi:hypothetical protein
VGRDKGFSRSALSAPSVEGEKSSGAASKAASSLTCDVEPPQLRVAAVRIVDMSTSNAWARTYATQMEALRRYRTGG